MSSMTSVAALLVLVLAAVPAMATDYTVGDSSGWTTGVDYSTWTSDKTFKVGDTLLFTYGFLHSVDEVGKSDYDACSSANSIQSYNDQSTKITLDKPGSRYFICGTPSHCSGGMKLAITVGSGSGSGSGSPGSGSGSGSPGSGSGSGSGSPGSGSGSSSPTTPSVGGSSPNPPSTPSSTPSEHGSKNTPEGTGASAASGSRFSGTVVFGAASLAGLALMG